jgi:biopolymer transport protein ExbD
VRRRRRHTLDLLPLLDVFMVVLFVFATIQERELVTSAQATETLQAELERARAAAGAAQTLRDEKAAAAAAEQAARDELARAKQEQAYLQQAMKDVRAAAERAAATATTPGAEALRRQDVLARLLDHFTVFEIEIEGEVVDDVSVNHCCYRTEPLAGAWRSCGTVPAAPAEREEWLTAGAGGLIEALRKTRGGNALTIVREDERAAHDLGRKLEEYLRGRLPEHRFYRDRVALHSLACPR